MEDVLESTGLDTFDIVEQVSKQAKSFIILQNISADRLAQSLAQTGLACEDDADDCETCRDAALVHVDMVP